jgi:hypothetical protein
MADEINRYVRPVHDRAHVGVSTYDAKDPNTAYLPISDVRPADVRPMF